MEDEFYHLTVKGNDLKAYVRRFQELATLCPTMVPDSEKMIEETFRSYAVTPTERNGYTGNRPLCKKCTLHHWYRIFTKGQKQSKNGQNRARI
ncbi:hypothetical protein Tco_1354124 [Tanacetum coccineum]